MENLLQIADLRTYFHTEEGVVKAVDDVTLDLKRAHTLGIVGESGSGKSVTSLSIMGLLGGNAQIESGSIAFLAAPKNQLDKLQKIQNETIRCSLRLPSYISIKLLHENSGLPMIRDRIQTVCKNQREKSVYSRPQY